MDKTKYDLNITKQDGIYDYQSLDKVETAFKIIECILDLDLESKDEINSHGFISYPLLVNSLELSEKTPDMQARYNRTLEKYSLYFSRMWNKEKLEGLITYVEENYSNVFSVNESVESIELNTSEKLLPQIIEAQESDLIKSLCSLKEFKFQKGTDKLIEFENYNGLSKDEIGKLLKKFNDSNTTYTNFIDTLNKDGKEYYLLILTGKVVSYCDVHAANKNEFNEYEDKRTLAKAGVRMNDWIEKLLRYKIADNDIKELTSSIKNAISYFKKPESGLTMLSENHREMVSLYLLKQEKFDTQAIVNDVISFFEPYEINVINEKNRTGVYCSILYAFEDVRKLWFEHIEGLVVCDNTGWIEEAIKSLNTSSKIALWWDKSPSGGKNVVELLEANFEDPDKPYFYIYYSVNQQITYRSRIVDFAFLKNYKEKEWNKNGDIAWFQDDFSEYQGSSDKDKIKKAKIVFLADKVENLKTTIDINKFIFYKNFKSPTQNNMQPFVEIQKQFNSDIVENENNNNTMKIPLNQIFYGPPGTGKTYNLSSEAEKIININSKLKDLDQVGKFDRIIRYIRNEYNEPIYNKLNGNNIYRNFSKAIVVLGNFLSSKYDSTNTLIHEDLKDVEGFKRSGWSQRLRYLTEFGFIEGDWISELSGQLGFDMTLSDEGIILKNELRTYLQEKGISEEDLLHWPRENGIPLPVANSYIEVLSNVSPISNNITAFQKTLLCALNMCLNGDLFKQNKEGRDTTEEEIELIEKYLDVNSKGNSDFKWIGWLAANLEDLGLISKQETERNEKYYFDLTLFGENLISDIINNWETELPSLFGEYIKYDTGVSLGQVEFITFHQSYSYEEFIEGIRPNLDGDNNLSYKLEKGVFKRISDRAKNDQDNNYVIIIDEINRGNISKIFGELITLIEPTKRLFSENEEHPKQVILPYSKKQFGVPKNLYILGTMNTADKSIALLDSALRRRFVFTEMLPKSDVVEQLVKIEGILVEKVLSTINQRIEFLIDKDHTIGHSYFLKIKEENTIQGLALLFKKEIIPLLMEYFYGDFEKIQLILGDNKEWKSKSENKFFIKKSTQQNLLFGTTDIAGYDDKDVFELTPLLEVNSEGKLIGSTEELVNLFKTVYTKKAN